MATYSRERRRGLPRLSGGEPWPPAGSAPEEAVAHAVASAPVANTPVASAPVENTPQAVAEPARSEAPTGGVALRQGLPRVPGGEPWPPASGGPATATTAAPPAEARAAAAAAPTAQPAAAEAPAPAVPHADEKAEAAAPTAAPAATSARIVTGDVPLRRGLPRIAGGEPWPPEGFAQLVAETPSAPALQAAQQPDPAPAVAPQAVAEPAPAPAVASQPVAEPAPAPEVVAVAEPAPAAAPAPEKRERITIREKTLGQWAKLLVLWGGGVIVAAGILVLAARGVTTLPGVPEFLAKYPGEYRSPADPEPGFPAWARWTHYLNFFFMLLIIRSGLLVRTQQKPDAFFTPKKGGKKISIYLWLHTSIDVLWLLNGVAFVVLLFVTGHWARIVPTSWEVFPNALSAALQYATLEWPHEDGWINYNSLQQLMYFAVVFIAAPLAAITGVRMSEWWPEKNDRLNRIYPAPLARAIHFPVMLFFVLFIIVHVFLVLTTGMLKNLNHMFVGTPEPSWAGFWMFALGLAVAVGVVVAARPLVIAPIANLFGKVSNR